MKSANSLSEFNRIIGTQTRGLVSLPVDVSAHAVGHAFGEGILSVIAWLQHLPAQPPPV
jgi:hypothetical protein